LPGINGYEVAKRIRAREWGRGITIAATTGWGQDSDRAMTRTAGCDVHLTKPVSLEALSSLLEQLPR
jgi:two-component system CheB/CheR fusion protein